MTLLALLKHPLLRLGARDSARAVAALERAMLRGPRPRPGSAGLAQRARSVSRAAAKFRAKNRSDLHPSDPRTTLTDGELAAAADLVAGSPMRWRRWKAPGKSRSRSASSPRAIATWWPRCRGDGGDEARLRRAGRHQARRGARRTGGEQSRRRSAVAPSDYVELFSAALADRVVRRPPQPGLRVRILGPLEARLTDSDRVVLGGLVEGTWPPESRNDAWLSRPMRHNLGLDLPERRIGLSAHDFAQMLGAREVILTRAAKIAGTPTVPSRFVQRLAAVAGDALEGGASRAATSIWPGRARSTGRRKCTPAPRPAPKPPRAARPKGLSVTEIEHWLRDPYTIYAKHILRLAPLDAVDAAPGAAERGTVIHAAIGEFTQRFADSLPADPAGELIALGEKHFAALEDFPEARAFWWPRFARIAHWFAGWEPARRAAISPTLAAEIRGEIEIPLTDGVFTLSGVADRIERDSDGRYVILDYKTGSARTEKQVRTGLAPQLTLEAAILRRGGFKRRSRPAARWPNSPM